ncbi:MAG: ATP-binding protein [Anaerolineales bacterium]|nr:ATP-binding protein [Anaerolineales bacterium]
MKKTKADLKRIAEQRGFVGRRAEQMAFRTALLNLLDIHRGSHSEDELLFKQIFLLHGVGGMGKTTLLNRLEEICKEVAENEITVVKVDWEEFKRSPVGSTTEIMEIVLGRVPSEFTNELRKFKDIREQRNKVRITTETARKEYTEPVATFAEVVSTLTATGSLGKKIIEETVHLGAKGLSEAMDKFDDYLQLRLTAQEFALYKNPQLEMSRAFVDSINSISERKPLVLMFDTYELIDRYDSWVREVIKRSSPKILFLIAGRHDHKKSYSDIFPEELIYATQLESFSKHDIKDYLDSYHWEQKTIVTDELLDTIDHISRGVPLAVKAIAEAINRGKEIDTIFVTTQRETSNGLSKR